MPHGEHVTVVTIAGDHLVAILQRQLHADDDRFLADIEVTEAADEAHAVELAGLFLEAPDQQHLAIGLEFIVLVELGDRGRPRLALLEFCAAAGFASGQSSRSFALPYVSSLSSFELRRG